MAATTKCWDRWDATALAILLAVCGLQFTFVLRTSAPVGVFEDDGVYLVTSRALATTGQYVRDDLPGRPFQTKYPILYPLLLSLVWRAAPQFPHNIPLFQAVNALCAAGALWLAYRIVRTLLGDGGRAALASATMVSAAGTCFFWVSLIQFPMSEPLFALLTLAALRPLVRSPAPAARSSAPARSPAALISGAMAAAAFLTRSIGIAVIISVVTSWLLRRRWRQAALSALPALLAMCGWAAWSNWAARQNAELPLHAALKFDLDYGAWLPGNAASLARVGAYNTSALAWSLAQYTLEPDPRWIDRAARCDAALGDVPFAAAVALAVAAVIACLVLGARAVRGTPAMPILLFLACYFGVVLLWPFRPDRFVVPTLPLTVPLTIIGAGRLFPGRGGTSHQNACIGLALLLAAHGVMVTAWRLNPEAARRLSAQREAAAELLRARAAPDAVVAGLNRGYYHLMSGRRFVPLMPYDDPYALYYPPDRRWWSGGRDVSLGQIDAHRRVLDQRETDYFRAAGVRAVLLTDDGGVESRLFARFAAQHASRFTVAGDAGPARLWRVTISPP
ncbi:MAG: hypothetical protein CHACPFDD_01524 [Phycisphaerae bacterium]|nr:hypothetical protein [Phycisphaerae bacterium]